MRLDDLTGLAKELAPIVRGFVDKSVGALRDELSTKIDQRMASQWAKTQELAQELAQISPDVVADIATKAAELVEVPTPEKGEDGTSITLEDVQPLIDQAVSEKVAEIPPAQPGKDGESVPIEDVRRMIDESVAKAVASIPIPKDGKDGRDAMQQIDPGSIDRVIARHVEANTPSVEFKGERSIVITKNGETSEFIMPVMLYRGVWAEGGYEKGDTVTWGGSLWHCNTATEEKPGITKETWTLCAKKGSDGK